MIIWAFMVVGIALLSYLADVGVISILREVRSPILGASLMSILLMLCGIGMMARILRMARKGEKEKLRKQLQKLEEKLEEKPPSES